MDTNDLKVSVDRKYIDAERFKVHVMEAAFELNRAEIYDICKGICEMVDAQAGAEVVPVVHGRWIDVCNDWIPVTERRPEHDDIVIAFFPEMRGTESAIQIQKGWSVKLKYCSHWMPLPEPPKEDRDVKN